MCNLYSITTRAPATSFADITGTRRFRFDTIQPTKSHFHRVQFGDFYVRAVVHSAHRQ
jgi:hypothetical protein